MKIILGSASKARREILKEMGYEFTVTPSKIDEKAIRHESPRELVLALANVKADALLPRITEHALRLTVDHMKEARE